MADLVGKRLKDFYVLRRLGRGAMAEVYLAQQMSLGRHVALKVLNADLARDPNYVRRFHHEARAAAALVHAGIVQIYEVGEDGGVHFIAQEYVDGRNLGEVIRSHGSLEPPLVLDILRQVAAALTKASSQGIVHRDIKPENIMLAESGDVKVADFGLARVQGDGGVNLTQVGVAMGTPLYMSPEQIEGRQIDSRSDIYSLGVSGYHMLTGEPPFNGDSPLSVAVQHLNQTPPPLAARLPNLPLPLGSVIEQMMAKKPADRFADPAALLDELNAVTAAGIEQGWTKHSRGNSLADILNAANKRAQTTARLDELMKTAAIPQQRRPSHYRTVAAVLGCALLGAIAATVLRPTGLLSQVESGPAVSADVQGQLYHAKMVDTEAAWLAVQRYFPNASEYSKNLARQGLVHHYLSRSPDYEKAIPYAQELVSAAPPNFQAFGLAGLVVAYTHLGDDERALEANGQLSPEMRSALGQEAPQVSRLLDDALDQLTERAL